MPFFDVITMPAVFHAFSVSSARYESATPPYIDYHYYFLLRAPWRTATFCSGMARRLFADADYLFHLTHVKCHACHADAVSDIANNFFHTSNGFEMLRLFMFYASSPVIVFAAFFTPIVAIRYSEFCHSHAFHAPTSFSSFTRHVMPGCHDVIVNDACSSFDITPPLLMHLGFTISRW